MTTDFYKKHFNFSFESESDSYNINKIRGSDWSDLTVTAGARSPVSITIRSEQDADSLWFALGQMLGK